MPRRLYYVPEDTGFSRRLFYAVRPNTYPVKDFPEDILFETVSGCNARCAFCPNGNGLSKIPTGKMPPELFDKIIDESVSYPIKRISPYLMNEPLLDRDIGRKIASIVKRRTRWFSIKINTNASLLDEYMSESLIDSGLDRLNISCHGISERSYSSSMRGLSLRETLANVDRFLELKHKRGAKLPKVTVTMVKTKLIEDEIPQIKSYWKQRNVSVHIRQLENRATDVIGQKGLNTASWSNFSCCSRLFTQAAILTNGDMLLCCVDYGYTTVLGNVGSQSIHEIWNSPRTKDIRRRFLKGDLEGLLCRQCLKQASL